jgi:hypothetical protein
MPKMSEMIMATPTAKRLTLRSIGSIPKTTSRATIEVFRPRRWNRERLVDESTLSGTVEGYNDVEKQMITLRTRIVVPGA